MPSLSVELSVCMHPPRHVVRSLQSGGGDSLLPLGLAGVVASAVLGPNSRVHVTVTLETLLALNEALFYF